MQDFLNSFWTAIEISDLQNVVTLEIAMTDKTKNFYYVPWEAKSDTRLKDDDIRSTTTFFLDIDIKENLKEDEWEQDQTEEWIIEYADWIKSFLETHFTQWRYIIFTGNGLQVHFIGNKVNTAWKKNQWKFWVRSYQEQWDSETRQFFWVNTFRCDKACCNLARLRRLPWTINQKNWREAKIIYTNDATFPTEDILPRWEAYYKKVIEQEKEIASREKEELRKSLNFAENNIFERINSIPAELIVSEVLPQAVFDGKKNFRFAWQHNLCGFYKWQNRIINWWSHHFQPYTKYWWERNSYSVFDMVHLLILRNSEFDTESIKKTIYFIKQNYGQ
jgi:hypothetical protein